MASAKKLPLGVRNNNPGNIEWGSPWEGLVPRSQATKPDGNRFAQFKDAAFGIRAIAKVLTTYADKYGISTIRGAINRWAPPSENDTDAYCRHVASQVGCSPDEKIDIKDFDVMRALVIGIIEHENAGYAYPDAVVDEGLRRAGYVKKTAAPKVPVNTATVAGAAAPAAVGLTQLAPIVPDIMQSISGQQDNLTSGDWTRAVIGVVLVALGGVVAYNQYQKRKAGAV